MPVTVENFITHFSEALDAGTAAIFAGAGLSKPAGFSDWPSLLANVASELDLSIDKETDLISLAQYHVNTRGGNRGALNDLLMKEFTKDVKLTPNHELIATLPIRTVWTTNYDTLLERAFKQMRKRPDVKITPANLNLTLPHRDVTVYKMHGDISLPHQAVLTREDYETYDFHRELFSIQLKGDLVSHTFVFVGFSFTDPNIDYLLSRVRILTKENGRTHYCIMRKPPPPSGGAKARAEQEYQARRLSLRIADLQRYKIEAVLIDDYADITDILEELNVRAHSKGVFVSGSADEFAPFNRDRLEGLARKLGRSIIENGMNLISGYGLGIGGAVILGAMEALYETDDPSPAERTLLRPFPQIPPAKMTIPEFHKRYREEMVSNARFAIFLAGNKLDPATKKTVVANGVVQEFEIAAAKRKLVIPIGATGHAAEQLWKKASANLDKYYGDIDVKKEFAILGDASKTDEQLVAAVFSIIKKAATPKRTATKARTKGRKK